MKLATFHQDGVSRVGLVTDQGLHPVPWAATLLELIEREAVVQAADAALGERPLPLDSVRLLPPLQPSAIRDFVTFERHVEGIARRFGDEVGPEWYEAPTFYFTNPHSLIGPFDDVRIPPGSEVFDFELEVAAVVGRAGSDLTPEAARGHIIGYTVLNDWSARDLQAREMRVKLGPAKGKDSASTLGPWLVTADELETRRDAEGFLDLTMVVARNGIEVGRDSLANMAWTFEEMVAYASRGTTVRPGDVLGSGTCGSGCLAELWGRYGTEGLPPLRPGDVITMTVDELGTISNKVVPGRDPVHIPAARAKCQGPRH
ncbi:fumarylacetoacetate hydrolase family protein [Kutzneria kofuensis]|uniref:2-keto-4-pentenoate hydratase/2-oxohepta-3-ene-1,7-dioic acid hydratase in catechol pathway n=1 Tax=Kutzneria kofuensis TaxID=103725 RepID=A0A7W9KLQ0_9PSEU|nr:fumarylacetoacetate hydrolase family protein [Kutzneria kofuensis]MBB5894866.1 2-keto-4-pentenoate hydratase/2-oxohepta-3-ene-1,7-dioic acid hydratase in catechol pathway [Kutzneria kofuensis]